MKKALFLGYVVTVIGCSVLTPGNIKTVLSAAQVACAIANASSDDQTIAQICGIANDVIPDLKTILSEHRAQLAKVGAANCK